MAIIKQLNKKTGITYVYESYSYRDKETKQPRSKRRLIGKIDEATGEIVPTNKRYSSHTTDDETNVDTGASEKTTSEKPPRPVSMDALREKDAVIVDLQHQIAMLRREKQKLADTLEKIAQNLRT